MGKMYANVAAIYGINRPQSVSGSATHIATISLSMKKRSKISNIGDCVKMARDMLSYYVRRTKEARKEKRTWDHKEIDPKMGENAE